MEVISNGYNFGDIIGFQDIKRKAINLANYDVDIMILRETGVGKEMYATAIHNVGTVKYEAVAQPHT